MSADHSLSAFKQVAGSRNVCQYDQEILFLTWQYYGHLVLLMNQGSLKGLSINNVSIKGVGVMQILTLANKGGGRGQGDSNIC